MVQVILTLCSLRILLRAAYLTVRALHPIHTATSLSSTNFPLHMSAARLRRCFGALAALLLVTPLPSMGQAPDAIKLGTNLNAVTDYSPQLPFRDLFASSRTWLTQCQGDIDPGCSSAIAFDTNESASLDLDSNGWVRSLPAPSNPSVIFTSVATYWDVPAEFPAGTYIVLYDGQGTIEYGLGATKNSLASSDGRDVVAVNPSNGGILLRITATNPADYIRNIRFVAEGDEGSFTRQRFSQSFLDQLTPYQAVRFMDWMQTNNSGVSTWAGRALPTDARFSTEKGVPAEIMIELANTTGKTPWFTLPHQANDEYIQSFATLAKASLRSDVSVYVEYSNEAWNGAFTQGAWIEAQGELAWPGGSSSGFTKRINYYGRRSAEICDIWRSVFGDAANRVVCITASQAANAWTADEALSCPLWDQSPCASHGIKALAIAPYIGGYLGEDDSHSTVLTWTSESDGGLDSLFSELSAGDRLSNGPQGGALAQSFNWVEENNSVAASHGVTLIAYEGGQHLVGVGSGADDDALTTLFTAANRDTRIGALYTNYLTGWASRGGGLFMHFNDISPYSKFGSWGALEKIGEVSTAKYDALFTYATGKRPNHPRQPKVQFRLSVRRSGSGTIKSKTGTISCGRTCSTTAPTGTKVTLTATPSRGYRFKGWSGACRHSKKQCRITMSAPKSVRGTFVRTRIGRKG